MDIKWTQEKPYTVEVVDERHHMHGPFGFISAVYYTAAVAGNGVTEGMFPHIYLWDRGNVLVDVGVWDDKYQALIGDEDIYALMSLEERPQWDWAVAKINESIGLMWFDEDRELFEAEQRRQFPPEE